MTDQTEVPIEKAHGPAPHPHRVLIVDDSAAVRNSLREVLLSMPAVGEIVEAADGVDALSLLSRMNVDLLITDVTMPRLDGFKLLSALRSNPRFRDLLVIMLSAHGESVDKVRGLTIGANDYVTKPFERGELQARVSTMLKLRELQHELQRKNAELEKANRDLERLANLDALTCLANRRFFFERLEIEFERSLRRRTPLALIMLDIDHFKDFNDRYGHQVGDEALRRLGAALCGSLRAYDLAGRYGGEEFIAFLSDTPLADAVPVAERLRASIAALRVPAAPGLEIGMTVSIGIACWPDLPVERVDHFVAAADAALYRAKEQGRNRCEVAGR